VIRSSAIMSLPVMSRRDLLTAAGTALLPICARSTPQAAAARSATASPPIGCFGSVVFGKFRLGDDAMLDAVKAAGYEGLDLYTPGGQRAAGGAPAEPTPEALASFKEKLAARGLTTTVGNLSLGRRGASHAEALAAARQSITNAHTLGQKYALTLGVNNEEEYMPARAWACSW